ncbi:MAG: hypothetical protein MI919_38655, partial [Holophagales bacterium]|nr:hypothetical protein [Holophagales bacterium]
MRQRLESVGGTLRLEPGEGDGEDGDAQGWRLRATVPFDSTEASELEEAGGEGRAAAVGSELRSPWPGDAAEGRGLAGAVCGGDP